MKLRLILGLLFCTFAANAQTLPTAPTAMSTTQPDTTGYVVKTIKSSGGDYTTLPTALTAIAGSQLTDGTILRYDASYTDTITSTTTLPYKNMSAGKWIIIETTSSGTSCPASGTRLTVAAAGTANLATIKTTTGIVTMLATAAGSGGNTPNHYWFRCVVLETTAAITDFFRIGATETLSADLPNYFVFDRIYIKAPDTINTRRGITANGNYIALIDSSVASMVSLSSQAQDTQTFGSWNGEGPFKIDNNYLVATGENIMFGAATPTITNLVGCDISVTRNFITKPLTWKTNDPSYDGINRFWKNLFEIKNGCRILLEGNLFTNGWLGKTNQAFPISFTPKSVSGTVTWATASNIEIRWNRFTGMLNVFSVNGVNGTEPAGVTEEWYAHDNLAEDVVSANWQGGALDGSFVRFGFPNTAGQQPHDITIEHNTSFQSHRCMNFEANGVSKIPAIKYVDNLCTKSGTGIRGAPFAEGNNTLNGYFSAPVTVTTNVIQGRPSSSYTSYAGNLFPATVAEIGFTTQSGYFCADCTLLASSPYDDAGTGGTPIGISNWATFLTKTCGAQDGDWTCAGGALPALTLASVAPTGGVYTGGTPVTLTGTNFVIGPPSTYATFDGVVCTSLVVVSSTSITCNTPAHAAGAVDIVVVNPDLQSVTLAGSYTYTGSGAATISNVAPANGSFLGGTPLRVTGTNFAASLTITVGGQTCGSVSVVGTTLAYCTVSFSLTLGLKDVVLTNPDGVPITASNAFTYTNVIVTGVPTPH